MVTDMGSNTDLGSSDVERIRALLRDISTAAREIWDKAPNVGPLSINIQRLSQSAFTILDEVQDRNAPESVARQQSRKLQS